MIRKLSSEELNELILASDERFLREELIQVSADGRNMLERPEEFWQQQRAAVWSKIAKHERIATVRPVLAWAAVAAMAAIGAFLVPYRPKSDPTPAPVQTISDQELLIQMERTMQSGAPESLQPAALLVQEMSQGERTENKESHEK